MPSEILLKTAQAVRDYQDWMRIQLIVGQAIFKDPPDTVEECESMVAELGVEYAEYPDLVLGWMQDINPEVAMKALLEVNPTFSLEDEPRQIVRDVVETLGDLRLARTPQPQ